MSGQSEKTAELFRKRTHIVSQLSQENTRFLRLLQRRSGVEILLAKNPDSIEMESTNSQFEFELENSQRRIASLERDVAGIDEKLESLAKLEES
ncbi:hypothetical protein [Ruegeria lacuscaerulensis]|uniref:hypothetical protein n=1 Tax=Ruegeria lacuscaerulensis TaxID=55218 RepID=UPI001479E2E8|nr:hypothetical protein [Ruegeria lacuscaerulensis]